MEKDNIYKLAIECKHIADDVNNNIKNYSGKFAPVKDDSLIKVLPTLCNAIKDKYPSIFINLHKHIDNCDVNYYSDIDVIKELLDCIIDFEATKAINKEGAKKIFISHSSNDKDIVKSFTDNILQNGIGIESDDIFCTSIEDMTMQNGDNIRETIKKTILSADYSFIMFSENYKSSDICLNEMGAVWMADNCVRYYLLPNANFDMISWLYKYQKFEKLLDAVALDKLHKEMVEYYKIQDKGITWSKYRNIFLSDN